MTLTEFRPSHGATPRGAIVVLHDIFGVTDYIEDLCYEFSKLGYHAVAPHLYHRLGDIVLPYSDVTSANECAEAMIHGQFESDLDATFDFLQTEWTLDEVATVGFAVGGALSLYLATTRSLGASATFYGSGILHNKGKLGPLDTPNIEELRTPWIGFFGELDEEVTKEDLDDIELRGKRASAPAEVVRYLSAGHGFHCKQRPHLYEPQAACDAWKRCTGWFDKYLGE